MTMHVQTPLRKRMEVPLSWVAMIAADASVFAALGWVVRRMASMLMGLTPPWWMAVPLAAVFMSVPLMCWLIWECLHAVDISQLAPGRGSRKCRSRHCDWEVRR
jgi:hypothetical protein